MKTKHLNANDYFLGEEPISNHVICDKITLINALNWYSANKTWEDSKKYLMNYLKSINYPCLKKIGEISEDKFTNIGFIARMLSRGFIFEDDKSTWIKEKLDDILKNNSSSSIETIENNIVKIPTERNIQDRIFDQATIYINDIENQIDYIIKTKTVPKYSCYDYLTGNSVKSLYTIHIKNHFQPLLKELELILNKEDEQLNESYSHWSKKQLKSYHAFVEDIINDCDKFSSNVKAIAKITRKPRKKKAISKDKLISKLSYKKQDNELKLVSINPIDILGAKQLWVYNTKYKILGCYNSLDDSGFSIKGTTIQNFDENNSIGKTIRKPVEVLTNFNNYKKAQLRNLLKDIKAKDQVLTGRINNDIILLRAMK